MSFSLELFLGAHMFRPRRDVAFFGQPHSAPAFLPTLSFFFFFPPLPFPPLVFTSMPKVFFLANGPSDGVSWRRDTLPHGLILWSFLNLFDLDGCFPLEDLFGRFCHQFFDCLFVFSPLCPSTIYSLGRCCPHCTRQNLLAIPLCGFIDAFAALSIPPGFFPFVGLLSTLFLSRNRFSCKSRSPSGKDAPRRPLLSLLLPTSLLICCGA